MIKIIKNCPECNSKLERVSDQLFCRNTQCSGSNLKKIVHFAKTLKIKGLGEQTIKKLGLSSIIDIYSADYINILGDTIGSKLVKEVENSKSQVIGTLVASLSIHLVGKTIGSKLEGIINLQTLTYDECRARGIGVKASNNLIDWIQNNEELLQDLPIIIVSGSKVKLSVCISGKVPGYTKKAIEAELANWEIGVKSSVTKEVKYLIAEEGTSSSKTKKAESMGVPCITYSKFKEKINVKEMVR